MFPALTFRPRRISVRRLVPALGAALLVLLSLLGLLGGATSSGVPTSPSRSLADRLAPSTWAIAVPVSWLGAPVPDVRVGDSVDLLAVRAGDRPLAIPIAADLHVMNADGVVVVVEVDEEAATAIAVARASNLLLVPLLRSTK